MGGSLTGNPLSNALQKSNNSGPAAPTVDAHKVAPVVHTNTLRAQQTVKVNARR